MVSLLSRRTLIACIMALSLIATAPAFAAGDGDVSSPSAAAMTFDFAVVRPLSLVSTVVGTGLFIVSLPFSLIGHNADSAGQRLVVEPAKYTFTRPLGNFDAQTPADSGYHD